MAIFSPEDKEFYCECGCGTVIPFYSRFASGHNMRTPEARERAARIARVYLNSPEVDARKSEVMKRYWDLLTPTEFGEKIGNGINSKACKEAAAEARSSPEYRVRASRAKELEWAMLTPREKEKRLRNGLLSEASKEARAEAFKTSEYRAEKGRIVSKSLKAYWEGLTPEEKAEKIRSNPWFHSYASIQSPNGPESMLWEFLDQTFLGIFTPDWIKRIDIGGRHPDFYTRNGYRLVIESNGSYFHNPEYFDKPTEEEQITHYKKYGYNCIVVWADSPEDTIFEWPDLAGKIRDLLAG